MARSVVFAPEALADLRSLYDIIADASLPARALDCVEDLRRYCLGFGDFPEQGTRRDAIRPSLRTLGYRRRVRAAFHVAEREVVIDRLLYADRDIKDLLREDDGGMV